MVIRTMSASSKWASLSKRPEVTAAKFARLHADTDTTSAVPGSASSSWARLSTGARPATTQNARGWAGLERDLSQEMLEPAVQPQHDTLDAIKTKVEDAIGRITGDTKLKTIRTVLLDLSHGIDASKGPQDVTWFCVQYDAFMTSIAKHGSHAPFLESEFDDAARMFATEQLTSTTDASSRHVESRAAESARLGLKVKSLSFRRSLGATAAVVLQRVLADKFVEKVSREVESRGGHCETYFEKHRGDETPYAKLTAIDNIFDNKQLELLAPVDGALEDDAAEQQQQLVAQPSAKASAVSKTVQNISNACKVYNTEVEIGLLYILPASELLLTFRLLEPHIPH